MVKEANVSAEDELKFTTEKIKENFSNYSSWHNRSKLLPQVFPDDGSTGKVKEAELLKGRKFHIVNKNSFSVTFVLSLVRFYKSMEEMNHFEIAILV